MRRLFTWRPMYALASATCFVVLVGIALFVRDAWIRPLFGDVLAVVWLYLTLRAVLAARVVPLALLSLACASLLEVAQYFRLVHHLGLEHHAIARTILGATFDPLDLLAYTLGAIAVLAAERLLRARAQRGAE